MHHGRCIVELVLGVELGCLSMAAGEGSPDGPAIVLDEVIEYVADLLGKRYKKHEIKAHIRDELEIQCSPRTVETLLARARKLMIERSSAPRECHLSNAIEFYEAVVRDDTRYMKDRLQAQARLDNLLGLERQFTSAPGSGTADELAVATREAMSAMREADKESPPTA